MRDADLRWLSDDGAYAVLGVLSPDARPRRAGALAGRGRRFPTRPRVVSRRPCELAAVAHDAARDVAPVSARPAPCAGGHRRRRDNGRAGEGALTNLD